MTASPIATMFDEISPKYDTLNHLLSFDVDKVWRRKTARLVAQHQPQTILDVATGTADLALALSKQNPEAHIVGVDISEKMLELGKAKITQKALGNQIDLQWADATSLPFGECSFDVVTVAFGVRNFNHLEAGLQEMVRVCRNQGLIAVLEFSHPTHFLIKTPYRWYSRWWIPKIGRKVSKHPEAYSYLPSSVEVFPSGEAFAAKLEQAGVKDVHTRSFTGGIATLYYGHVQKSDPLSQ